MTKYLFHPAGWTAVIVACIILVLVAGGDGPLAWVGFAVAFAVILSIGVAALLKQRKT